MNPAERNHGLSRTHFISVKNKTLD